MSKSLERKILEDYTMKIDDSGLGLFEIIFCVEDETRDFILYTTKTDFEHSWFCTGISREEDLRLMTVEDLEHLIGSLQHRIDKMKALEEE